MPETNSTSTMEWWANKGTSTYHRFIAHFVRNGSSLLRVNGPRSSELKDAWSEVEPKMNAPTEVRGLQRHEVKTEKSAFTLFEKEVEGVYCGVCLLSPDDGENPIDAFMSAILIKQARLVYDTTPSVVNPHVKRLANELTDLFDEFLRYEVPDDYWKRGGRDVFYERVEYFVSRDMMIEFVLPAFPCKSSNPDKVGGNKPDRGEELALRRLHAFIAEVEEIYEPGGKMWVVSDGHVFSDCIGVDDEEVDTYTSQLIAMNEVIAEATDSAHRVGFFGLVDLFDLDATPEGIEAVRSSLPIPKLDHHVETSLTDEAETCRQILMGGCTCEAEGVRARIDGKDPSIMALYKGFSRFMLEDLDLNKGTKHMTKSQKRKTSTKVAFEMILRNQAYSNLVEMVFPNHCRLSIHAHKNSGPKFGIQLFDPRFVRTTNSLEVLGKPIEQVDLLHIPTPWHNSIVEIEGSDVIWVCKSSLARESVKQGKFLGQWEMGPDAVGASFRYLSTIPQSPLIIKLPEQAWPKASDAICSPIATRRPNFKIHGAQAPSSGFPAPVRQTTWSRNAVNAMPRSAAGKPLMTVNVPGANKVATPVEKKSLTSAPIVEEVNPEDSPTSEKGIAPTALPLRQATAQ